MKPFPHPSVTKLLYIGGPFTKTIHAPSVRQNIQNAQKIGKLYLELGYTVFIPHSNWGSIERNSGLLLGYEEMMQRCLVMLDKCDGAVFLPGWEWSKGSKQEVQFCKLRKIPLIFQMSI